MVHVVLIVEDDLQAVALLLIASSEVLHLDRLAELGLSQNAHYLEPASEHLVDHYRHLPLLLEARLLPIVDHLQLVAGVHDSIRFNWVNVLRLCFCIAVRLLLPSKMTLGGRRVGILSKAL